MAKRIGDLKINISLKPVHEERMASLGLSTGQISKAFNVGIDTGNYYHWKALLYCAALGEIDAMLDNPTVYIEGMKPAELLK